MSKIFLWPVTIVAARYGGAYEGGEWVAFNADPLGRWSEGIQEEAFGDDTECSTFWSSAEAERVGRGASPDAALADLERRLS